MSSINSTQNAATEATSGGSTSNTNYDARKDEELSFLSSSSSEQAPEDAADANDDSSALSDLLKHLDTEERAMTEGAQAQNAPGDEVIVPGRPIIVGTLQFRILSLHRA
jgi:hypothetical protein